MESLRRAVKEAAALQPGQAQSIELRPVLVYEDPSVDHWRVQIVIT